MTLATAVALVMFAGIVLYAVFGGADFGSGVWDLTAGRDRRGAPLRRLVDHAIGPVWEANHVWLIFVIVLLWTGFPEPFAALMRTLSVPFWLAGLGIVGRGAAFAFRKYAPSLDWARTTGFVFAFSSLLTPFFFGTIAGSIASGRVPAGGGGGTWSPWLNPTSILGGVLAVATCTFLAGVFLTAEADKLGAATLTEELRTRSTIGGILTGAVVIAGIPILIADSPDLVDGLLGRGLPIVIASAVAGLAALRLLNQRRYHQARVASVVAVASVVTGWGAGQYPWILVGETTIEDGAGARATLVGLLVAAAIAAVLVVPPLVYLLRLADDDRVGTRPDLSPDAGDRPAVG